MKEILFKAKKIGNGEWAEGSLIVYPDGDSYICGDCDEPDTLNKYKVDPETVCRYTGLTDKNNHKIWENNICIVYSDNLDEKDRYFIVKWDDDGARFILKGDIFTADFDYLYWFKCEVIGNIFDNPELLEMKK